MTTPSLALTLGQIKSRVKRTMGDQSNVQIQDSDIIDWSNAAVRDLVKLNDLNKVKATANIIQAQSGYVLPVGISSLKSVKYNGQTLEYLSLDAADEYIPNRDNTTEYPTGTPQIYYVYNNTVTLYPAPDSNITGGLTLYYTIYPDALVDDTDVPSIPLEYHNRIIDYCLSQAYELNGNFDMATIKMNQFTEGRRELSGKSTESETGPYPFITDLSEYDHYE